MGLLDYFKKKKMLNINSKYKLGEFVSFNYRDDLKFGNIVSIEDKDGKIFYDIQIGGECPVVIENISEGKVFK